MNKTILPIAVLLLFCIAPTSPAAVLAAWELSGVNSSSSPMLNANSTTPMAANIDSRVLSLSSSVSSSGTNGTYGFSISNSLISTNLDGAIAGDHYMQFSIAAEAGYVLNLSSLEFYGDTSLTGPANIAVLSLVNGFNSSAVIDSVSGVNSLTKNFNTDSSGFGGPIDVSGSEFQGVQSVDFRIYGWGSINALNLSTAAFRNGSGNDLIINGSVTAVPEPSTTGVLAILIVYCLLFHRYRRSENKKAVTGMVGR